MSTRKGVLSTTGLVESRVETNDTEMNFLKTLFAKKMIMNHLVMLNRSFPVSDPVVMNTRDIFVAKQMDASTRSLHQFRDADQDHQ